MEDSSACDVLVIGAGPAGMLAAARAAQCARRTLLVERNRKPGAKILMSGGTRCNLTHAGHAREIVEAFGPSGRFLKSALAEFGPQTLIDLMAAEGVPTKVEPGGKVFPESDRAADVQAALVRLATRNGATLVAGETVAEIARLAGGFQVTTDRRVLEAEKLILATGGRSYPGCGTTGDGYRWAETLGHTVVPTHPALVPVTSNEPWIASLQGITVADVGVQVFPADVPSAPRRASDALAASRGSFLFTHFGLSGPAVLDVSRAVSGRSRGQKLVLQCDFLPDVRPDELERRFQAAVATDGKRQLKSILADWLPQRLAEGLLAASSVDPQRRGAECSKAERRSLIAAVKEKVMPVTGTLGFEKAEVTAGGVSLDEVDSRTMHSKLVPNLFIVGELLDLDGPIGGYNFQAAFSTGWRAGGSV
jgi:predicted Rossmann fold flavoprotein